MLDVYVDRRSNFLGRPDYVLWRMLCGLQEAGLRWRTLDRGGTEDPAELAFVHVDLTELPSEFLDIGDRCALAINGKATTIDRRMFSRLRLMQADSYGGPVIVKTVRNGRGYPELRYAARKNALTRLGHVVKKLTMPGYKERKCPSYRVCETLEEVPASVWGDERLLVERFAPGTLNPPFTRYKYNFFLDIEQNTRSTFSSLIYEDESVESYEVVSDIPDEIRRVRQLLHLDYGAIEYFVVDDDCFVIDANKTVTQPDAWIDRFPSAAKFIQQITVRLVDLVKAGGCKIPCLDAV